MKVTLVLNASLLSKRERQQLNMSQGPQRTDTGIAWFVCFIIHAGDIWVMPHFLCGAMKWLIGGNYMLTKMQHPFPELTFYEVVGRWCLAPSLGVWTNVLMMGIWICFSVTACSSWQGLQHADWIHQAKAFFYYILFVSPTLSSFQNSHRFGTLELRQGEHFVMIG